MSDSCPRIPSVGCVLNSKEQPNKGPDLHAAIREARKTYQSDGTMPDWAALEALIGQVRLAQ